MVKAERKKGLAAVSHSQFMFCLVMLLLVNTLAAQEIVTAPNYFTQVAQTYETVEDYLAEISISRGEGERMTGQLYYRHPNLLRIDFTQPEEQVLVTDGESLTLYIPAMNVTMKQSLADRQQGDDITAMASREGLGLLRRMYNVSYLTSPTPVPLEEGSSEMVVKLRLTWRNPSEGFREIIVSIGSDMLIRRMVGTTVNYDEVVLDFSNIQINQNIPVEQFDYRSPPSANQFHGFLFGSGN